MCSEREHQKCVLKGIEIPTSRIKRDRHTDKLNLKRVSCKILFIIMSDAKKQTLE
jgi:hypothetical protein